MTGIGILAEIGAKAGALGVTGVGDAVRGAALAEEGADGDGPVLVGVDGVGAVACGWPASAGLGADVTGAFVPPRNQSIDGGCMNSSTTTPIAAKSITPLKTWSVE
jgi:hypothetical protein